MNVADPVGPRQQAARGPYGPRAVVATAGSTPRTLPDQGITISGTVSNLLDNRDLDVLGAPIPHRFAWLQLTYDYDGLKF